MAPFALLWTELYDTEQGVQMNAKHSVQVNSEQFLKTTKCSRLGKKLKNKNKTKAKNQTRNPYMKAWDTENAYQKEMSQEHNLLL